MKTITQKVKPKFEIGQTVYFKHKGRAEKTKITGIMVETLINSKGKEACTLKYKARGYCNKWANDKSVMWFKDTQLFSSKEALAKGILPTEEKKILAKIKAAKNCIRNNKLKVKEAEKILEEIRHEELVEELSGL